MISDLNPILLDQFKGLFARGATNDNVPRDHFSIANNLRYYPGGFRTRGGLDFEFSVSGEILRFHVVKIGTSDRLLILISGGSIYDSQNLSTPILTIAGMTDFSCLTLYDRVYITPHDRVTGLSGRNLYVYLGSGIARQAGGDPPASAFTANTGNPGNIEAGVHKLALVYITDTGYVTTPGPDDGFTGFNPVSYTAPGGAKLDLTNLPVAAAGTGVITKQLLATKAGLLEYFFVPNAIAINAITSLAAIDFTDAQLVDSADYLFDIRKRIPAGLGLARYSGRMVVYGFPSPNGSLARVSRAGNPEQISDVDGNLLVDVDNKRTITNAFDLRGSLHIIKEQGVHAYVDNGLEPSEWGKPITVDDGIGSTVYGVAQILDESGQTTDKVLIADRRGLVMFDGVFHGIPLSWKIQDNWDGITPSIRNQTQVVHDPVRQLIFVSVVSSYLLVADYSEGLTPESIKWSRWTFSNKTATSIGLFDLGAGNFELRLGSGSTIYKYNDTPGTTDSGTDIVSTVVTGPVTSDETVGTVNFFGNVRLRIRGSGNLIWSLQGEDGIEVYNLPTLVLQSIPGRYFMERCNLQSENAILTLSLNSGWMNVNKVRIFANVLWPVRPSI